MKVLIPPNTLRYSELHGLMLIENFKEL